MLRLSVGKALTSRLSATVFANKPLTYFSTNEDGDKPQSKATTTPEENLSKDTKPVDSQPKTLDPTASFKKLQQAWNFEVTSTETTHGSKPRVAESAKTTTSTGTANSDESSKPAARGGKGLYHFQKKSADKQKKVSLEELQQKHLKRYQYKAVHSKVQENDPASRYQYEGAQQLQSNLDKTKQAMNEYYKGEEGVDRIDFPVHPEWNAFAQNSDAMLKMQNQILGYLNATTSPKEYKQWRKEMLENRDIQEALTQERKIYPGSPKGPHPAQDPEYYADWLERNLPPKIKQMIIDSDPADLGIDMDNDHQRADSVDIQHGSMLFHETYQRNVGLIDYKGGIAEANSVVDIHSPLAKYELPPLPQNVDKPWKEFMVYTEKYTVFRMYPRLNAWINQLKNFSSNLTEEKMKNPYKPLPTLYAYYNLLPDSVRASPLVKNTYVKLERNKHLISLEQKQIILNFAAQFTLPMDPELEEAFAELVETTKHRSTIAEDRSIIALDSEDERFESEETQGRKANVLQIENAMDPNQAFNRMESVETFDYEGKEWPAPKPINAYVPEEEPSDIPVDYYDNEDGFWDDYIAWKEAAYNDHPMIRSRPYFKH